jgi:hypothetical protein
MEINVFSATQPNFTLMTIKNAPTALRLAWNAFPVHNVFHVLTTLLSWCPGLTSASNVPKPCRTVPLASNPTSAPAAIPLLVLYSYPTLQVFIFLKF